MIFFAGTDDIWLQITSHGSIFFKIPFGSRAFIADLNNPNAYKKRDFMSCFSLTMQISLNFLQDYLNSVYRLGFPKILI